MAGAQEAILLHFEALLDDSRAIPEPSDLATLQREHAYRGWTWAAVDVDLSELSGKAARVNITLPQRIRRVVDLHARRSGLTRSGFLVRAAVDAMREPASSRT